MDGSTKDLTSSERFESAIEPSRAEPSRAEPSRAEPSRAEPSRAEPSRAEPSRAEPSRAEPSRAEPSRAEPSRAEPSRAEPSRAEPSRAEPSRAEPSRAEPLSPTRARECCCPPPPDRLPPRRGGGSSPYRYVASAAVRRAGFARLADAPRALVRSARAVAAVACLCLAGPLALPAQAQTTNFYLWRTTLTVGEDSGTLGYDESDSLGSISTDAEFGYPPWNPPHKHHVDRESYYTVEAINYYVDQGHTFLVVLIDSVNEIALGPGNVTLWLNRKSFELRSTSVEPGGNSMEFSSSLDWVPELDWDEDDEVRVALVYERRLPSAPQNVSVTAPPGEDGTLEVSWDEPDDEGTFPVECYLVEFRHPSGEAKKRKQSYPGSLGPGKGCGDSPPTSVTRTDLETGVQYQVLVQALSGDGFSEWSETKTVGTLGRSLRAWFESPPERHDGKKRVKVQVAFSEPIDGTPENVGQHGVDVEGGRVTSVRSVGGNAPGGAGNRSAGGRNAGREDREVVWEFEIEPDSDGDVTVSLDAGRPCGEPGAICTADGRSLSEGISTTVEGPDTGPAGLTATFEDVPAAHRGEGSFRFRVAFSDGIKISYKTVRDASFTVTAGDVTGARRVDGRRDLWEITVEPASDTAVTVRLPETTDCGASGAICTSDGRPLSHALSATVAGPVGIAVADARVEEGAGAVLAFAVTLSRAASAALTVDYATADGSAHAGDDYTAASGTLTFQTGESAQTITVAVLDDAHNEGEETLTLTLSNVSGGHLTDGEATGTIDNADPLPRALLARFGRTAAVHVVEHVEARLAAPRAPGIEGRIAGRELRPGMERELALSVLSQLGSASGVHPVGMGSHGPMAGSRAGGMGSLGTPGRAAGTRVDDGRRVGARRHGGSAGRRVRAGRRAHRRRTPPDGPRGRGSADRLGVRDEPGDAPRRHPLVLEPGGAVVLRGPRGRAVARRGRADDDGRGRLREGAAGGGAVALAQPGPGRVCRRGRRAGDLVGDGPLPVAGLQGDRPRHGVGRGRLRRGRAAADAAGRPGAGGGPVDGDGGGGDAGRAGGRGLGRLRAGVQGRCAVGRHGDRRRRRPGGAPGGDRRGGDPVPDGPGGRAHLHARRPAVADAERRGRAAARRRGRRDRGRHGHGRGAHRVGRVDGAGGGRAGADAGDAPGRGVPRAGRGRVAQLQPDATDAAGLCGASGAVVGR